MTVTQPASLDPVILADVCANQPSLENAVTGAEQATIIWTGQTLRAAPSVSAMGIQTAATPLLTSVSTKSPQLSIRMKMVGKQFREIGRLQNSTGHRAIRMYLVLPEDQTQSISWHPPNFSVISK